MKGVYSNPFDDDVSGSTSVEDRDPWDGCIYYLSEMRSKLNQAQTSLDELRHYLQDTTA